MIITSLVDDYCPIRGLRGEHGLSLLLELGGSRVLVDTGQGELFLRNAAQLGIDLSRLDAVVLTHGHYDHGGGLDALYGDPARLLPPLIAGSGFGARRLSRIEGRTKDIGLAASALGSVSSSAEIAERKQEIAPGLFVLPAAEPLDGGGPAARFLRMEGGEERFDDFGDELSIAAVENDGLTVITGCAHRGIFNIVEGARRAFPGLSLKAVVGGFHLADLVPEPLSGVAERLASCDPQSVYCSHCTGPRGFAALSRALSCPVTWLSCGMKVSC